MKRIKKEFLPENLRYEDGRKTADIFPYLSELSAIKKEDDRKTEQRLHAERLLRRENFDKWVQEQRDRAGSKNDLKRINNFLEKLERNPDYKVETVLRHTVLRSNVLFNLTFDFNSVKVEDLRRERL